MAQICPAVLAHDEKQYRHQIEQIAHFAHRIQIDLTDGVFASPATIKPEQVWWPAGVRADIHLMYKQPLPAASALVSHKPNLIIAHAEAEGSFDSLVELCRNHGVKVGVALLPQTSAETILPALSSIDYVLIFSGDLGHYGGRADLKLLNKSSILKSHKPSLEIGWDGGADEQNISELITGGVDVVNVGGYIHNADNPSRAYTRLQRIADETGTT